MPAAVPPSPRAGGYHPDVHAEPPTTVLPTDDPQRRVLHDEVHARPSARVGLPALVTYVAVLNEGVSRDAECEHLRRLPGQQHLVSEDLRGNFLRLALGANS